MSAYEGSKMQEQNEDRKRNEAMFGKKYALPEAKRPTNIPDGNGESEWTTGAETFSRQEVFKILFTQRAMIQNDIKRSGVFDKLPEVVVRILENPRTPNI